MPEGIAPDLPGVQVPPLVPPQPSLVEALQAQSDLRQLPTEGGVIAFANVAWPLAGTPANNSVAALAPSRGATPAWLRELGVATGLLAVVLGVCEGFVRRRRRRRFAAFPTPPPGDVSLGPDILATEAMEPPSDVGTPGDVSAVSEAASSALS